MSLGRAELASFTVVLFNAIVDNVIGEIAHGFRASIVRNFQASLEVETDPSGTGVTLRTLVHAIVRLPGEPFPCIREELALYGLLTNGRGEHDFSVELSRFELGLEIPVSQLGPLRIDLGQDPLAVLGLPIPLRDVIFPVEGQYAFHLICDGQPIADAKIIVR